MNAAVELVVLFSVVSLGASQVPVPKLPPGHTYGNGSSSAPIQLDFFIDLQCSDTKEAFPTLLQVADYYGGKRLRLLFHFFPLPYHRNSYVLAQGAELIAAKNNEAVALAYMNAVFRVQDRFLNKPTENKSAIAIISDVAAVARTVGVNPSQFINELANYDSPLRTQWKYGCTRGVAQTPDFFINGIQIVQATPSWSLKDWKKIIDPLLTILD
ncbi:uncharacterized protein LOC106161560 [Lingula anatina]|uniref:Uncharacterized protein LOC106161560 n=1 Tax=Lingula anatina TaxID=7574 RepID=A0A1S3I9E8_LINAN|nr:uncharacterized protein LOC106161560 [Lingula anatina]|eukprot:XP_013394009.1 uncharacterized protein LOC106161560 [Lingula anatina]